MCCGNPDWKREVVQDHKVGPPRLCPHSRHDRGGSIKCLAMLNLALVLLSSLPV